MTTTTTTNSSNSTAATTTTTTAANSSANKQADREDMLLLVTWTDNEIELVKQSLRYRYVIDVLRRLKSLRDSTTKSLLLTETVGV